MILDGNLREVAGVYVCTDMELNMQNRMAAPTAAVVDVESALDRTRSPSVKETRNPAAIAYPMPMAPS